MLQISENLKKRILKDSDFSKELSNVFSVKQVAVENWVKRNSKRLKQFEAVNFYKQKGYTEEQIFEKQKV